MENAALLPSKSEQSRKIMEAEKNMLIRQIMQMPDLPSPSPVMVRVIQLLRYDEVKVNELVKTIERDQSLVAQILKIINSGYYSLSQKIDNVNHAIALLGIQNLKQIVFSISVMELFSSDEKNEWEHAYTSSLMITSMMSENELPVATNLPMTALIHDLGKVVLQKFRPQKYKICRSNSEEKRHPIYIAEDAIIKLNHAEIGSILMQKWNMTDDIIIPIKYHHRKDVPSEYVLETALLKFANWVDCLVRNIPCNEPEREIMSASGIEEIDKDYWIRNHRELVCSIHNQNLYDPDAKDKKTNTKPVRGFR